MDFTITAIAPDVVAALLERDDAGREPRLLTDDEGGSPLRCCLTKAAPGERIALVSYAPLRRWAAARGIDPGAYDEQGPIFVHAEPCQGAGQRAAWPSTAHRMLRAYGSAGTILGGHYLPGDGDPETALKDVFDDPEVAVVHVRAVEYGCFQFEVTRTA